MQETSAASEVVGNARIPNPATDVTVSLLDSDGGASFVWDTGKIHLCKGLPGGATPVDETGFDGDVIAHEYVHAILHYYYRPFFEDIQQTGENHRYDGIRRGARLLSCMFSHQ